MSEEKHKRFQDLLAASDDSVWDVMRWLGSKGYAVRKEPMNVAPTVGENAEYKDDADFEVCMPFEVKQLSTQFSGISDWPHGSNFIVDSVTTFDAKKRKPWRYLYLSADKQACAILEVRATQLYWWKQMINCGNYSDVGGLESEFYLVNTKHVTSWHIHDFNYGK